MDHILCWTLMKRAQDRDKLSLPSCHLKALTGIGRAIQINKEAIMSQDATFNRCIRCYGAPKRTSSQKNKSKKNIQGPG